MLLLAGMSLLPPGRTNRFATRSRRPLALRSRLRRPPLLAHGADCRPGGHSLLPSSQTRKPKSSKPVLPLAGQLSGDLQLALQLAMTTPTSLQRPSLPSLLTGGSKASLAGPEAPSATSRTMTMSLRLRRMRILCCSKTASTSCQPTRRLRLCKFPSVIRRLSRSKQMAGPPFGRKPWCTISQSMTTFRQWKPGFPMPSSLPLALSLLVLGWALTPSRPEPSTGSPCRRWLRLPPCSWHSKGKATGATSSISCLSSSCPRVLEGLGLSDYSLRSSASG